MGVAMEWVARIFAATVMMCLPGLGGQWLDAKLGTRFLAIVGFVLGLVGSMYYLIAATRQAEEKRRAQGGSRNDSNDSQ